MVSIFLSSVLFGPSDLRIVLLSMAPTHDVVMFHVLFQEDGCNWEAPWLCTFFPLLYSLLFQRGASSSM
jgi:hypothetical protein